MILQNTEKPMTRLTDLAKPLAAAEKQPIYENFRK